MPGVEVTKKRGRRLPHGSPRVAPLRSVEYHRYADRREHPKPSQSRETTKEATVPWLSRPPGHFAPPPQESQNGGSLWATLKILTSREQSRMPFSAACWSSESSILRLKRRSGRAS